MEAILIPIVSVVMVFSIPIVAMIVEYMHKKNKARVIEKALERGVPIENLKFEEAKVRMPYRSGMVMVAIGVGVAIFGAAIGTYTDEVGAMPVFLGGGAVVGLIGLALLINDRMNYDRFKRNGD